MMKAGMTKAEMTKAEMTKAEMTKARMLGGGFSAFLPASLPSCLPALS